MTREISQGRKATYYVGAIIMIIGGLMFFSTFVTFAMHFGDFDNFEDNAKSSMFRAFGGIGLLILGGIVMGVGRAGLAGSGAVLDPKQAREDLEPYSRMAGGMFKDALDESGISLGSAGRSQPDSSAERVVERVVMIKCPACATLNEEDSKFCQECGGKL